MVGSIVLRFKNIAHCTLPTLSPDMTKGSSLKHLQEQGPFKQTNQFNKTATARNSQRQHGHNESQLAAVLQQLQLKDLQSDGDFLPVM